MGMRSDQFMGLNEWASKFVQGVPILVYTEEVVRVYPDGRRETQPPRPVHESSTKRVEDGKTYSGMFEDTYPLGRYIFPNGQVYYEEVQAQPWSAGPVFFLALRDEKGEWVPESLWPDEEIENA
jgi:hypothetical protein